MAIGGGGWFLYPPNVTLPLLFVPRVVSAVRWMLTAKIKRVNKRAICHKSNLCVFAQSPCCNCFRSTAMIVKPIIAEVVVNEGYFYEVA